jgi:myo-inositol-1(or 4)-monophosphatase
MVGTLVLELRMTRADDLARIKEALEAAGQAIRPFTPGVVHYDEKSSRGDPVTAADLAVNEALLGILPRAGEGWLSEETRDSPERLGRRRVWMVDPLDGTREFVDGIPEWCISVGLVEDGEPVAGGIYAPQVDLLVLGSVETGVTHNGRPASVTRRTSLKGATILASRSEWKRGEWERYADAGFRVVPCGSVAFKLAQVAVGLADGTWTLVPKHEWDVAAGAALVMGAGGTLLHADGSRPRWNQPSPKLPDFLAARAELLGEFRREWGR